MAVKYYCKSCDSQIKPTDTVCPKCGRKLSEVGRRIEVTLTESIALSDSIETSLIINPIPEIEKSLKEQDYFKVVTYLAAILEYYGKLTIVGRLQSMKRNVDKNRIYNLTFQQTAIFLYGLGIIDQPCYSALIALNNLRNTFLHIRDLAEFRRKCGKESEATIRRAINCIDVLLKK